MWFLQTDTLLIIFCAAVFMAAVTKIFYKKPYFDAAFKYSLLAASALGVFLIDRRVFLFYAVYTAVVYLLAVSLYRFKNKPVFAASIFICFLPLLAVRLILIGFKADYAWLAVGIAFNMLKAADAIFYVYYAETKIELITFVNFIFFLPTFTAGPIMRYRDFKSAKPKPLDAQAAEYCVKRIIRGGFKKLVVTYFLLQWFNHLLKLDTNALTLFAITVSSYFILYFDLSGYSDAAIAFGRVFGITVAENFKNPFKAPSFSLFWRNWHVTLSDWIREHIFVVFSGVKLSKLQTSLLAFFTMLFMSLWHGFNGLYLAAGVFNGILLMAENLLSLTGYDKRSKKSIGNKMVFYGRCFSVNFLFAVNTLVFTVPYDNLAGMLESFKNIFRGVL